MAEKNVCRECKFYEHQQGQDGGHCYGQPPQLILVPAPQGGAQLSCMDPTVPAKRPACSVFEEKSRIVLAH